ncbi:MAG: thioredoxin-disulfide reductase [Planctomycetes bacterium]|nr:thioredoxin-disulfide reductase [Planctomycetota bacterium]
MSDDRNVIIIGSGPAGYTAAIYTARANLKPLMFEGYQPGGQLMLTTEVENFPGFRHGIQGPDLMAEMRAQCERFGTEIFSQDVERVDFSSRPFRIWAEGKEFRAATVIVATGAKARLLGVPGESRLMGHGMSTCATCDGAFFRNKVIAVAGGGDSAMEEANFLTRFGSKVLLIHRRESFRASKIMLDRARANPKVEFVLNAAIEEVLGDDKVTGVRVKDTITGATRILATDALFVAIGHTPTTAFLGGVLTLDENGYLVTHHGAKTNIPGVFACGDCQDHVYRQAITAAASGCMAAIDAERWLEANAGH